ncbi:Nucleoside-diphosphate-sugar epimerase [Penicillium canescens]|uniref:Nucleoside-diphosphate-sugar epimerase n=1 Tax=Penicillium canescens TaxID=5083 RepID=A0AAD6IP74_PENCN|nr:Nucleoside-diphosphate-sugar epimerase [Penicillium canescens]KAJ6032889.1 Nucleoside-diphosphate-sugar epimerase [Penicillium canescens]KAJ6057919.1 Nucleoside-diphosphate-sugar epimerase [Penicillium canescens]KAJ6059234.1 Nucleoside-diphosphate-sugar epimerase [Penicillium canescens]
MPSLSSVIAKGSQYHTPEPRLWVIHTSGTGILTVEDQDVGTYGIERPKQYNDWDGVSELVNLRADAFHPNVGVS